MESTVIERLRTYLKNKGIKNREVASFIGISETTLNNKLNGTRSLDLDTLLNIVIHFEDLSVEWLLRGDGEMIKENNDNKEMPQSFDAKVEIDEEGCLKIKIKK